MAIPLTPVAALGVGSTGGGCSFPLFSLILEKTSHFKKKFRKYQVLAKTDAFLWYTSLCANTYLDARVERINAVNSELEDFIRLLKRHPELYSALQRILAPQEPQHEEREVPSQKA